MKFISWLEKCLFLLFEHCLYGSPSNPGGHLHFDLWFSTVQNADGLHGLSVVQGLMQALFRQAWFEEHSTSDEQPIGSGSTENN